MDDLRARVQAALGDAYHVERELTGGGMSRLFIATERSLRRQVVVKLLPPQFTSEVSAARFEQEIQVAARLQHPNILPVLSAGAKDDLLYYIMPYVPGESLRHRLAREQKLPVGDAVRILAEIADALAYAHAEGVVHRDIKPENILLEGSHAVLTDFGVARALVAAGSGGRGKGLTDTGVVVGTPAYMSPEQAAGEHRIDARSDVYALAVVGYEMLSGTLPFEGATARAMLAAQMTAVPKPVRSVRSDSPIEVSAAIGTALAKDPDQRFPGAAEFRDAITLSKPAARRRASRRAYLVAGALVLVIVGAVTALANRARFGALDENLIAVAPFDVFDPKLSVWHEGLVDIMARNVDGAGPIHSVSPTLVVRKWSGRADPTSAAALARRTGARLALYGQVVAGRADSVRLTATLLDAGSGRPVADFELRGSATALDRLTDSLTVALLRELGKTRPIGAVRRASFGSTSLPALKAFLQGEQQLRRADWDSALAAYNRAVEVDSTFALALRRIAWTLGWKIVGTDSISNVFALRAGAHNRGLAPRDSLLVAADSLEAVMFRYASDPDFAAHGRRLFQTLNEATRRYPDDPEVWYALGDAQYHFGFANTIRSTIGEIRDAFDRAIALDSAFTPSYIHPVELALATQDSARARRYAEAYLSRGPTDVEGLDMALVAKLLVPSQARSAEVQATLDTSNATVLAMARSTFARWPDSAETAVRLAAALARGPRPGPAFWSDTTVNRGRLATSLAARGHLRDAYAQAGTRFPSMFGVLGMFGVMPPDSVDSAIRRRPLVSIAAPGVLGSWFWWWESRADAGALRRLGHSADSMAAQPAPPVGKGYWQFLAGWARASESFARHDTAEAVRRFEALPDSLCGMCVSQSLSKARVLAAAHREEEALRLVDRNLPGTMGLERILFRLETARLSDKLGHRDLAIANYQYVLNAWRHADPELQPLVAEARAALIRLTGEPRPQ
jgi:serine/threonine-protein kinase